MGIGEVKRYIHDILSNSEDADILYETQKELNMFIFMLYSVQSLSILARFRYFRCCFCIFKYLTTNGYLKRDYKRIDTEVLSNLFDIILQPIDLKNKNDDTD